MKKDKKLFVLTNVRTGEVLPDFYPNREEARRARKRVNQQADGVETLDYVISRSTEHHRYGTGGPAYTPPRSRG